MAIIRRPAAERARASVGRRGLLEVVEPASFAAIPGFGEDVVFRVGAGLLAANKRFPRQL
jgi:hypothetical protein